MWPVTVDWDLRFSRPHMRKAQNYWQSLCQGRRMPARRELNPRAMKEFIPFVNLVDVVRGEGDQCDYIVSLQSNHARDVLGNIENRQLSEVLPPAIERHWRSSFDLARTKVAPVRLTTRSCSSDKQWLAWETFLAPLGHTEVDAIYWAAMAWPITRPEGK